MAHMRSFKTKAIMILNARVFGVCQRGLSLYLHA